MNLLPHDAPAFWALPVAARLFVTAVVAAGAACLVTSATRLRFDHAMLFIPADGRTFDELLAAADARMYRDKAGRRSRSASRQAAAGPDGA